MTIATTENKKNYDGDGIVTVFAFPFLFPKDTDLDVYIFDETLKTNTLQTITTDYTVTGAGLTAGGDVTMIVAPTSLEGLVIIRSIDITQGSKYEDFNRFPADTVEANLDRLTMICQQLQEQLDRSIVFDVDVTGFDNELPAPVGDTVIGYNTAGTAFENKVISVGSFSVPASGMLASDGTNTLLGRTISEIGNLVITNGNGLSGNPTIDSSALDTSIATNVTDIALRTTIADLVSTDNGKGGSLVGFEDAAGASTATDMEAAVAELFVGRTQMVKGTYTGNASTQAITGLGFQPTKVFVHRSSSSPGTADWTIKVAGTHTGTDSEEVGAGIVTDEITALDADGFSVGTGAHTNTNTATYGFEAYKF